MGVGGQDHALATLLLQRDLVSHVQDGYKDWSVQARKISPLPGFDVRTIQPIVSCYTNYAIVAHSVQRY
jgi:hypothetical protein